MMLTLFPGTVSQSAVALANPSLIGTGGPVSPFRQWRDSDVWGRAKLGGLADGFRPDMEGRQVEMRRDANKM